MTGFTVVARPRGLDESERKRLRGLGEGVVATHLERVLNAGVQFGPIVTFV